jgi:chaperonin cofactor prefoldin
LIRHRQQVYNLIDNSVYAEIGATLIFAIMAKLTRYTSFKELKRAEEPIKTARSESETRLSQFEELLARIRSEFAAQNTKSAHGK